MKTRKEKSLFLGALCILGTVLIGTIYVSDKVYAQTNSTLNQTSIPNNSSTTNLSAQQEASQAIKGAITDTGGFLGNVTQKLITSKSAGTILNETSDLLGEAYIEAKKFFSTN
ncbi:hypothetical protein [Candidatus Nitrosocosmicus franklandus]|uniref:Uncharacterized protein n=1 Tax=Candidatus Nitrosocosmicus franklandianus TaxID=1798806 RepID=A0A484I9E2_9ARCH|nr:hypothetical protein [Candidatus Nitrosocosmicus franklandus]VFJ13432.1 conserved exported protein of unknown function [Candidatus Nitrosocosmicus franklandus]